MRRMGIIGLLAAVAVIALSAVAHAAPVSKATGQSRADVLRYWTAARMKAAVPVEQKQPGAVPAKKTTYPYTAVTPSTPYTSFPTNTNGKVFFTEGRIDYVCSGTALQSGNESVVWTAGHCVNDGAGTFHTNWAFVPAYLSGDAPYGRFTAQQLLTTSGWSTSGDYRYDVGAAVVGTSSTSGATLTGGLGGGRALRTGASVLTSYTLYGYPAGRPFDGKTLRGCAAPFGLFDPYSSTAPQPIGVGCNMTGGSSGGAWLNAAGEVVSVNSFGYTQLKNVMFGPQLGTEAAGLYAQAAAN